MRIISGHCRGRKLVKLKGQQIRPTSDRIREAVFNILGQTIKKTKVLDLFAGSGALGIEALSRGACHATFIDMYCDIIHQNLELCHLKENSSVISCDLIKAPIPKTLQEHQFDLVFIDPPYGKGYIKQILEKNIFIDLLAKNCIIIAEQSWKETLEINISALDIYRQKKYSKTNIYFIKKT